MASKKSKAFDIFQLEERKVKTKSNERSMGFFVTTILPQLPQATFFLCQISAYSGGFYSLGFSSRDLFLPLICVAKTIHPGNVQVHTWIVASLESSSAFTPV